MGKKEIIKAPRGTSDYLPEKAAKIHHLDLLATTLFERYGYRRIVTPTFEETDLFRRSIGEASDIVRKEMYTFTDRSGRQLTLRPEATAPVVRAYIEHHLYHEVQPVKLYYVGPMFRYERPQAGRYREFLQLGVEALGSMEPEMDAEVIILMVDYLRSLGLKGLTLHLGSMGCQKCRSVYQRILKEALLHEEGLCKDCKERLRLNPLRVFDCKVNFCRQVLATAPKITDHLCSECQDHLQQVEGLIERAGVSFILDSTLVRGFDYYTRTTFEARSPLLGAQDALGGGGRYDKLVEEYGGPPTPAIGFALGVERIILALEKEGISPGDESRLVAFLATVEKKDKPEVFEVLSLLRNAGISADMDFLSRSLKSQMKLADKRKAQFVLVFGPEELSKGKVRVREMFSGKEEGVLRENLIPWLKEKVESFQINNESKKSYKVKK